jgi:septal ring-binding cell division protein DamX
VGVAVGVALGFILAQFVGSRSTAPVLAAAPTAVRPDTPAGAAQPAALPVAATAPVPAGGPQAASRTASGAKPAAGSPSDPADPIAARLSAGRDLIAEGAAPSYAVQLMVTDARSRGYLENYLVEAGKSVERERLFLVPAGSSETPRLGVLIGGFRERGEALAALDALPEPLRQFRPYVRPIDAVREDARRAEVR